MSSIKTSVAQYRNFLVVTMTTHCLDNMFRNSSYRHSSHSDVTTNQIGSAFQNDVSCVKTRFRKLVSNCDGFFYLGYLYNTGLAVILICVILI